MNYGKDKNNNLLYSVRKYAYWFITYVVMAFALTQVVVFGSKKIANAVDSLFAGEEIIFGELIAPFF